MNLTKTLLKNGQDYKAFMATFGPCNDRICTTSNMNIKNHTRCHCEEPRTYPCILLYYVSSPVSQDLLEYDGEYVYLDEFAQECMKEMEDMVNEEIQQSL